MLSCRVLALQWLALNILLFTFWHFQDFLLLSLLANGNEKKLLANKNKTKQKNS